MLSRATIEAAARVTEYAASRPVAFDPNIVPTPPADEADPALNEIGQAAAPESIDPGPQGGPEGPRNGGPHAR